MQTFLSKTIVATVTIASAGLVAAPQAQAFVLGGFGISGTVNLTPTTAPPNAPTSITGDILSQFVDSTSGAFTPVASDGSVTAPNPFTFVRTTSMPFALYQLEPFTINLTGVAGFPGGFTLAVNSVPDSFIRVGNSVSSSVNNVISLTATDNEGNTYFGSFGLNDTLSNTGTFSLSFTSDDVPEPLTMLGASAAIAFGAAFKRRNANKG
ncbi:MAG: PEP-CTERM sorting domain-containing protein [Synechocystis sp.]